MFKSSLLPCLWMAQACRNSRISVVHGKSARAATRKAINLLDHLNHGLSSKPVVPVAGHANGTTSTTWDLLFLSFCCLWGYDLRPKRPYHSCSAQTRDKLAVFSVLKRSSMLPSITVATCWMHDHWPFAPIDDMELAACPMLSHDNR